MRDTDPLFDRLHDAVDRGNPLGLRFRELRACARLLEMHVAEETPDLLVVEAIERLFLQLAHLRALPDDRIRDATHALLDIKTHAHPSSSTTGLRA